MCMAMLLYDEQSLIFFQLKGIFAITYYFSITCSFCDAMLVSCEHHMLYSYDIILAVPRSVNTCAYQYLDVFVYNVF